MSGKAVDQLLKTKRKRQHRLLIYRGMVTQYSTAIINRPCCTYLPIYSHRILPADQEVSSGFLCTPCPSMISTNVANASRTENLQWYPSPISFVSSTSYSGFHHLGSMVLFIEKPAFCKNFINGLQFHPCLLFIFAPRFIFCPIRNSVFSPLKEKRAFFNLKNFLLI